MNWDVLSIVFLVLSLFCFYFTLKSHSISDRIHGVISSKTLIFMILGTVLLIGSSIFFAIHMNKKQTDLEYYLQFQNPNNKAEMFCYNEFVKLNKEKMTVSFEDFNIRLCMKSLSDKDLQKEKDIIQKEILQKFQQDNKQ